MSWTFTGIIWSDEEFAAIKSQTYENHRRLSRVHHMVLSPLSLVTLVLALVTLIEVWQAGASVRISLLVFLLAFMVLLTSLIGRRNALVVQDRGILTDQNLRHFILTGKPLDNRLTLSQIIALRFASDEEFVQLAARAVQSKMTSKEIKQAVQKWQPDLHRV